MAHDTLEGDITVKSIESHAIDAERSLLDEQAQALLSWWEQYHPELPARHDFDPLDHHQLCYSLFLVKKQGEDNYQYKVRSPEIERLSKRFPNSIRNSGVEAETQNSAVRQSYQTTIESGKAHLHRGILEGPSGDMVAFESLSCPLLDAYGNPGYIVGSFTTKPIH